MARYSRRFVLQTLVAALPVTLLACGQRARRAGQPAEALRAGRARPRHPAAAAAGRRPRSPPQPAATPS